MDMSKYEIANNAVFYQLLDPSNNRPLFEQKKDSDGKNVDDLEAPIGVMILGSDSEEVKAHVRQVQNKANQPRGNRQQRGLSAEEMEIESEKAIAACITELIRIEWKGEKLEAPKDNRRFLRLMPWASDQLDRAIQERARFMPALSKN